jgi:hypothetical protein
MPTDREIVAFLALLGQSIHHGHVQLTEKAEDEIDILELSFRDVLQHLAALQAEDFIECQQPRRSGYEPLWLFAPYSGVSRLYIKLQRRQRTSTQIFVISFHNWGDL